MSADEVRALSITEAVSTLPPTTASYDHIQSDPQQVRLTDLTIASFLGAPPPLEAALDELSADGFSGVAEKLDDMSRALRDIPTDTDLWAWEDSAENRGKLERLYSECALPGFSVSHVTKLLHRKRPFLLPVVDEECMWPALTTAPSDDWTSAELTEVSFALGRVLATERTALEKLQQELERRSHPLRTLTPLRLYDLLCWQQHSDRTRTT